MRTLRLIVAFPFLVRKTLEAAYVAAVKQSDQEGNRWSPRSTWGMAQGLTAISQGQEFADNRVDLDRKAGRILQMTF